MSNGSGSLLTRPAFIPHCKKRQRKEVEAYRRGVREGNDQYLCTLVKPVYTDEEYKEMLCNKLSDPADPLVEFVFQRELSSVLYLQVGLRFSRRVHWRDAAHCLGSDKGLRMHVKNGWNWPGIVRYCRKEWTRVQGASPCHYKAPAKDGAGV